MLSDPNKHIPLPFWRYIVVHIFLICPLAHPNHKQCDISYGPRQNVRLYCKKITKCTEILQKFYSVLRHPILSLNADPPTILTFHLLLPDLSLQMMPTSIRRSLYYLKYIELEKRPIFLRYATAEFFFSTND